MRIHKFHGGIHPPDHKSESAYFKIEGLAAPKTVTLPLSQSIGARANAVVEIGERVLANQKVAEADGAVSANLHSPVSGVVSDILPQLTPQGNIVSSIIIENDFEDESVPAKSLPPFTELTPAQIIAEVAEAGIVGMGGATFPTHVKLNPQKPIDTVIINGCECEPYLSSDHRQMLENPELLLLGAAIIQKALDARRVIIAIEDNKRDAIRTLKSYANRQKHIFIRALPERYPQGSEKHLIYALFGREVPPLSLPADLGVSVFNVDTAIAIAEALQDGTPLTRRYVTVAGSAFERARNLKVPLGTPISHVIDHVGGFIDEPVKILVGGPMMGFAQCSLAVPIMKGTGAIIALTAQDLDKAQKTACLRCGRCISVCPMKLRPTAIMKHARLGDREALHHENAVDCVECGACTFVCPAKIHILQWIKSGKHLLSTRKD